MMHSKFSLAVGVAFVVVGGLLLLVGLNAASAPLEQVAEALTGRYSDRTRLDLLAGSAILAAGAVLSLVSLRR